MTSAESTAVGPATQERPRRPETGAARQRPTEREAGHAEGVPSRASVDPLHQTDRYRLAMPFDSRL